MKSFFTLLLAALAFVTTAQPQKIHYQGVAVGANGKPLKNSTVGLRLSVLDSLPTGTALYTETQTASTDASGMFSIFLGAGTATAGTFANLPWANGNDKFLKVEMDALGGSNYQPMGITQLVSVPYAMAAGSLREGALLYGNNGQKYQITIDSTGPKWTFIPPLFACGQAITYAGESYATVQIGTQCWFAKNLNVGTMITGTSDQTNNSTLEKYCYNDDTANCSIYAGLYQWAEAVQYQNGASNTTSPNPAFTGNVRGICPTGWHLPSDGDWCTLTTFLDATVNCGSTSTGYSGNDVGGKMKSTSGLWVSPNSGATNSSGFSALPGGVRSTNGTFGGIGYSTTFWSSSEYSATYAFYRVLGYYNSNIFRGATTKTYYGFSVRCINDTAFGVSAANAGPDQTSLTGTTATLAANAPAAGETGSWSILSGSGGSLSNHSDPTATFTKGTDSAYTLIWSIQSPLGRSTDTVNLLFPAPVVTVCGQAITYAGESYPTVQIGTQCWFQKNVNAGTMVLGANDQTNNGVLEKYCYNDDTANCSIYGGLYQWAEAVQYQNGASNSASPNPAFSGNVRGICPTGWHLPSDAEWSTMTTFLGGYSVTGGALKSTSGLWTSPNTGATNSSGFSALPGGFRGTDGSFYFVGDNTYFWSSSEYSSTNAFNRYLSYGYSDIVRNDNSKNPGFSARCTQD